MQQVTGISVESKPSKTGYRVPSREEKKEAFFKTESHIYKQGPLTGIKVGFHKLTNDIFTYFPKGFAGSKNSDFYEYLSLGMIPYAIGSVMMALLYCASIGKYGPQDKIAASKVAKNAAFATALYAVGKWVAPKISRAGLEASTGIPLDQKYINRTQELPEKGQEKGISRVQYPGVYDSVQFYRKDLLAKDAELNHGNIYYHDDRIAKKAGYKHPENAATNQFVDEKIRGVKARATALENVSKYMLAATGVALGFQKAFAEVKLQNWKKPKEILKTFSQGIEQLWKGREGNALTKHGGKFLMLGSLASIFLAWLIPTVAFKINPNTMKSTVDPDKEYEVN